MKTFIALFLILVSTMSFSRDTLDFIVRFDESKVKKNQILKMFPYNSKAKSKGADFLVISSPGLIEFTKLLELKKLPGVLHIEMDYKIFPQSPCIDFRWNPDPILAAFTNIGNASTMDLAALGRLIYPQNDNCQLFDLDFIRKEKTLGKGINLDTLKLIYNLSTAKMNFDKDLIPSKLKSKGKPKIIKVGVFDTGYAEYLNSFMTNPVRSTKMPSVDNNFNSEKFNNHGTSVISVFNYGRFGLSQNSDITSVQITPNGSSRIASFSETLRSMEEACKNGTRILNLSFTGNFKDTNFLKTIKENGCLVFKSAGNPGQSHVPEKYHKNDDGIIYIGSTDLNGRSAKDYAVGEIGALGIGFPVVNESFSIDLENGSSLSSPAIGAMTTEIMGYLSNFKKFNKLSPTNQAVLLERLILASQVKGNFNAARMGQMAINWLDSNSNEIPTSQELKNGLTNSCNLKTSPCLNLSGCKKVKECVLKARKKLTLCNTPDREVFFDLMRTYYKHGAYEGLYSLAKFAPDEEFDKIVNGLDFHFGAKASKRVGLGGRKNALEDKLFSLEEGNRQKVLQLQRNFFDQKVQEFKEKLRFREMARPYFHDGTINSLLEADILPPFAVDLLESKDDQRERREFNDRLKVETEALKYYSERLKYAEAGLSDFSKGQFDLDAYSRKFPKDDGSLQDDSNSEGDYPLRWIIDGVTKSGSANFVAELTKEKDEVTREFERVLAAEKSLSIGTLPTVLRKDQ